MLKELSMESGAHSVAAAAVYGDNKCTLVPFAGAGETNFALVENTVSRKVTRTVPRM